MIQAKVVADSKNEFGNRITTMVVTFPRIILAEFNTHRMFSRNSASSRAIPFEKMVKSVEENPFIPIAWQKDHKGMQGTEYFTNLEEIEELNQLQRFSAIKAANRAKYLNEKGVTKQLCNRWLEPYMWHTVIVTATEWENFFTLRCPKYGVDSFVNTQDVKTLFRSKKDATKYLLTEGGYKNLGIYHNNDLMWLQINKGQAEIHMMALAEAMWDAYNESTPKELKAGEWHIPFGDSINQEELNILCTQKFDISFEKAKIKIATARCARVSYTVVGEEGKPDNYENDIKLHDKLSIDNHWSPFEHCAKCPSETEYFERGVFNDLPSITWENNADATVLIEANRTRGDKEFGWSGNFRGFIQYRKMFNNENITK